jgi:DUF4097 and DUF4098 domain-containing protein YvlB
MKKSAKIWLIIASLLVIIGAVMFAVSLIAYNGDFSKFATAKYQTNTHEISEEFKDISIDTDTANIVFLPSDDGKCKVECYERENETHFVKVENGTLKITYVDQREWYEYISINFGSTRVTVYLPSAEYSSLRIKEDTGNITLTSDFGFDVIDIKTSTGDVHCDRATAESVKIRTSTGNIELSCIECSSLDLGASTGNITVNDAKCSGDIKIEVSTGNTKLQSVSCKSLTSSGDTGDILLKKVIASEKFSIETDTGDIDFNASDAAEIFVETDTGDVCGTLLSSKVFITETDTGDVDVPKSTVGGRCEITTSTGDIEISIN